MKTTDEWLIDIQTKAEKRYAKKRKRDSIIARVSCAICLVLAVSAAVALPKRTSAEVQTNTSNITSTAESSRITKSGDENTLRVFPFRCAPVVGKTATAKKYRDPKEHYTEMWSAKRMTEYWGADLLKLGHIMPDDLKCKEKDSFNMLFYKDGTLVDDAQHIWYKGEKGREVCISIGKLATPYDCIYEINKEYVEKFNSDGKSVFNGVEMQCGAYKKVHGEKNEFFTDTDYFYFADFKKDEVYYRIEAYNLYPDEFRTIIEELTEI